MLDMQLGSLGCMMAGMMRVSTRGVCVMSCCFVVALLVLSGGLPVVLGCVFVVLCGFVVVLCGLF